MVPLRIEPARGKIRKDDVEPSRSESWDVLNEDVAGSKLPNDPSELPPKTRALAGQSGPAAGEADVLAREPAAEDIDPLDGSCPDVPDVRHAKHVRPVLRKNSLAEPVDLALPQNSHTGSLKAEIETPDA
jgi:hypothetical protein